MRARGRRYKGSQGASAPLSVVVVVPQATAEGVGSAGPAASCSAAAVRVWKWENIAQGKYWGTPRRRRSVVASPFHLPLAFPATSLSASAGTFAIKKEKKIMSADGRPYVFRLLRRKIVLLNYDCLLITGVNFAE